MYTLDTETDVCNARKGKEREKKMEMIKKITKEPRSIIAIVNFISFFLPWVSFDASVAGYSSSTKVTGFGMISYSVLGIAFYVVPIFIVALPFIESLREYAKKIYLVLSIWSILCMFITCSLLASTEASYDGAVSASVHIPKLLGFWIALICNVLIFAITLLQNKSASSSGQSKVNLKNVNLKNINMENISNAAHEIGATIQSSAFVECKKCGNKIPRGKKFCSNCGEKVAVEEKVIKKYKCSGCGKPATAKDKFCSDCGAPIEEYIDANVCPNCGKKVLENASFCTFCGTKIEKETK